MAPCARAVRQRVWQTLGSVRTGIVLLILVGIAALAGTVILQRPINEPQQIHQAYSPQTLRWLDALGLTDVFHSWWFIFLLALLSANIIVASIDRFPQAWRYFSRPYRKPEPYFLSALRMQQKVPIRRAGFAVEAAEIAFRQMGLKPQRVPGEKGSVSLYAERNRLARLAPYVVHVSLLLILAGGIIDALWGYKGFIALGRNERANQIELRDGTHKALPFAIRCDGAGQENYPDGTPKRWWSKLAVLENGREVKQKEIEVNEPLVHRGLRFFQSSYGPTGEVAGVKLLAVDKQDPKRQQQLLLRSDNAVQLDADTTVRLAQFVPDFMVVNNQIQSRSNQLNNPAVQLSVESAKSGPAKIWLFPRFPEFTHGNATPFNFQVQDLEMGYFTGLQVSYEPGQWAVWAGVILMGLALAMIFYFVHVRYWAVPVEDGNGRLALWVGASASKDRDEIEARFEKLVEQICNELNSQTAAVKTETGELVAAR